jgi:hypothetical protein
MSTTITRQTHMEQILIEVTSLLVDRACIQLEREVAALGGSNTDKSAANALRRLHELEKELHAIRQELGLEHPSAASASPPGRQVSKFYEVPGQEDA